MNDKVMQYRAVYGRPWSFLDRDLPRGEDVIEVSPPLNSKSAYKVYDLNRSEETLAYLIRWEERELVPGEWRTVENPN